VKTPRLIAALISTLVGSTFAAEPELDQLFDTAHVGDSHAQPTGFRAISADALVLAFDMTSTTQDGRLRDFGPFGLHGVITRARIVASPHGGARDFLTVADRVDLPDSDQLALDGPLTLAARLRVSKLGIHQHIIACDDKFALWITPEDRLRFVDTRGHGAQTAAAIPASKWLSVVAVLDGTKDVVLGSTAIHLYIDGRAVATEPVNRANETPLRWLPGPLYPTDSCYIGFESHQGAADHQDLPFVGAIDDLLVFRRAWTAKEAAAYASQQNTAAR
jgi:hypothetical protein